MVALPTCFSARIQFNLSDFTRRAYGTNYIETLRVQLHANCRPLKICFFLLFLFSSIFFKHKSLTFCDFFQKFPQENKLMAEFENFCFYFPCERALQDLIRSAPPTCFLSTGEALWSQMSNIEGNKMKPTNPNADTYVEEQRQHLFLTFSSEPTCETPWVDTLRWHSCRTPLLDTIAQRFLFDALAWHSCLTLLYDTLTWHCLLDTLVRHSYLTRFLDTCVGHSYLTLL